MIRTKADDIGSSLEDILRGILADMFGLSADEVHDGLSAAEILAWDSLHHFTLIASLEDQFGVTYTSEEIPEMTSLPALVRVTAHHLGLPAEG